MSSPFQLTPTPVSCITYELTPVATPFTAFPTTSLASSVGSPACIEEIIEYPKPHPATVELVHQPQHHQQSQQPSHLHHHPAPQAVHYVDAASASHVLTPTSGGGGGAIVNPSVVSNSSNATGSGGHNELLSVIEAIGAGSGGGGSSAPSSGGATSGGEVIPIIASSGTNFTFLGNSIATTSAGVGGAIVPVGSTGLLSAGTITSMQPVGLGPVTKVQNMLQPTALQIAAPVAGNFAPGAATGE